MHPSKPETAKGGSPLSGGSTNLAPVFSGAHTEYILDLLVDHLPQGASLTDSCPCLLFSVSLPFVNNQGTRRYCCGSSIHPAVDAFLRTPSQRIADIATAAHTTTLLAQYPPKRVPSPTSSSSLTFEPWQKERRIHGLSIGPMPTLAHIPAQH